MEELTYKKWVVDAVNELRGDPSNIFNKKISKRVDFSGEHVLCHLASGDNAVFTLREFIMMVCEMSEFENEVYNNGIPTYPDDKFKDLEQLLRENSK